jgi:hypothetical protein
VRVKFIILMECLSFEGLRNFEFLEWHRTTGENGSEDGGEMLRRRFSGRWLGFGWMLGVCLLFGAVSGVAQSGTPSEQENPFPSEPQKTQGAPQQGQKPVQNGQTQGKPDQSKPDQSKPDQSKPDQSKPDQTKREDGNTFPGENSDAPIIPVDPGPGGNSASEWRSSRSNAGGGGTGPENGDPVRSPDGSGHDGQGAVDDGFSSSSAGLSPAAGADDESTADPTKSTRSKSRAKEVKEDVDVGGFYLDRKNWKAARERFSTAFALDAENPEAVWGLAEAERHLMLLDKAREHYELFLSYDPKGPRSKAAHKALDEVEAARSSQLRAKNPAGQASETPR